MKIMYFSLLLLGCTADLKKSENEHKNVPLKSHSVIDTSPQDISLEKLPAYKKLAAYKGDTLSYLRENFIARKSTYLNKPAKVLLAALEIPVVKYITSDDYSPHHNRSPLNQERDAEGIIKVRGIYFKFENDAVWMAKINSKKITNTLYLTFEEPFDNRHTLYLYKKHKGAWVQQTSDYYGSIIIKDISLIK